MPTPRPPVGGSEESKQKVDQEEQCQAQGSPPSVQPLARSIVMAFVRVEQRNARLAAPVRVETVSGRDGPISRGTVIVISNARRGSGEGREEEATSILWTLWGKQADNAAEYLAKGSRVNVIGRLQNNNYSDSQGATVYGLTFTCEEIDYLDSKGEAEARRSTPGKGPARGDKGAKGPHAYGDSDVPF